MLTLRTAAMATGAGTELLMGAFWTVERALTVRTAAAIADRAQRVAMLVGEAIAVLRVQRC